MFYINVIYINKICICIDIDKDLPLFNTLIQVFTPSSQPFGQFQLLPHLLTPTFSILLSKLLTN